MGVTTRNMAISGIVKGPTGARAARRDIVALGIAASAILMFIGTGSVVLPAILRQTLGMGSGPGQVLTTALLLNIALIVFGWRRYTEMLRAIARHRSAEEQARILAETDPLTGCLNRRSIGVATDELLETADNDQQAVAFIMVDLDDFKQINDMNGHKLGDEVLRTVADRLSALAPEGGLVARLGGDEFSCVVPYDAKAPSQVDDLALLLIDKVAEPVKIDGLVFEITMSVGLASSDPVYNGNMDGIDADTLMHHADIAMYHAKKKGKNRYFWFEGTMEEELRFRNELEAGIRLALNDHEFVPYYEQQIDLETGNLMGFEMLARWESPRLGVVSPTVFIPIAEEIGVIGELSDQLLEKALEDAKGWAPHLTMSVNISPVQLRDPWFSQKLLKMLVQHSFPPQRLDVEITESCLHENVAVVRSIITSLRNQGVRISLDDFGTGYSSLAQLRTLPFDRLKIDRSFVSELNDGKTGSQLVDAIVSLGNGLNLPMTAEGIEIQEILDALREMGQLKGQGFLYGRPENSEAVNRRLAQAGLLSQAEEADGADKADNTVRNPFGKAATG